MPKHLAARLPLDAAEVGQFCKLAHSVHPPADWIGYARMVVRNWDGLRTRQIAAELACHPERVRTRLHAFTERELNGLGMQPGSRRHRRPTARSARAERPLRPLLGGGGSF